MILLDGFFEGVGVLILAIAGILGIRLIMTLLMSGVSELTGKSFVHRGRVLSSPQKKSGDKISHIEQEKLAQQIKKNTADAYAQMYLDQKAKDNEVKSDPLSKYSKSVDLKKVSRPVVSNEKSRLELMKILIECGLSKEDAVTKAIEKYPLGS